MNTKVISPSDIDMAEPESASTSSTTTDLTDSMASTHHQTINHESTTSESMKKPQAVSSSSKSKVFNKKTSKKSSLWRASFSSFFESKVAMLGAVVGLLLVLAAVFAPWITPQNPYDLLQLDILDSRLPPGSENGMGTFRYWLGTDGQGRDLYSAIIYGLRISLIVGLGSALIASVLGTMIG